jgi:molecular chaperone DnaK
VETLGGVMTPLIQGNTTIPTRREEIFSTAEDGQTKVEIHVLQGERAEARNNRTLGRFHLEGIMPAPRGVPKVKVTFDIDANGILSVTARDEATQKDQKITITAGSGLSEAEIAKMVDEGKSHEDEDKKRREQIEVRNRADQLCYQAEKALDETKDKLPEDKIKDAREAITSLRAAIEKQDDDAIQSGLTKLEKLMGDIAVKAYEGAGGAPGGGAGPDGGGDEGGAEPKAGGKA